MTEVQSIRNLFRGQLVIDEEGLRKVRLSYSLIYTPTYTKNTVEQVFPEKNES